jgi:hypothetical protein
MLNTQSTLILTKQGDYKYIKLYFKYKNILLRIPTDHQYLPGRMTKDFLYTSKVEDYINRNDKLKRLKRKVDEYISYRLNHDWFRMSNGECK